MVTNPTPDSVREIAFTRDLNAPPGLVFEAWTDQDQFPQWFGPEGVDMPFCRIEPRAGGRIHFCHEFGGERLWIKGAFREFEPGQRLVFALSFVDEAGQPAAPPMVPGYPLGIVLVTTVELEAIGGRTRMAVRQVVEPPEAADSPAVRRERGMAREGWAQTLDQLSKFVARAAGQ